MTVAELHLHLDGYLAVREALGFRLQAERTLLRDFVRFIEARGCPAPIRAHIAVEWATSSSSSHGPSGQASRLSMARKFLSHLRATLPETEVPDHGLVVAPRRPKPYLFSQQEIHSLILAASSAGPRGSLRPYTLSTLIGLLASTGLRIGEAIRLTVNDVKLHGEPPHLLVRETKFGKSRLVPVHATTSAILGQYADHRVRLGYDALSDAFFVSERGGHLDHNALWVWFGRLNHSLGIHPVDGSRRPCFQCIRHTFAVRRMVAWYQAGLNVQALLPNLSIYLGHVHPQESYWYLTATPELLNFAAERFRVYASPGGEQ